MTFHQQSECASNKKVQKNKNIGRNWWKRNNVNECATNLFGSYFQHTDSSTLNWRQPLVFRPHSCTVTSRLNTTATSAPWWLAATSSKLVLGFSSTGSQPCSGPDTPPSILVDCLHPHRSWSKSNLRHMLWGTEFQTFVLLPRNESRTPWMCI